MSDAFHSEILHIFQISMDAMAACPDLEATVTAMEPNTPTIVLGLVVFLLHQGLDPDQVVARFRDKLKESPDEPA